MGLDLNLDLDTKSFDKIQTPGVYDFSVTKVVRADKGEKLPTGLENRIADDLVFVYLRVVNTVTAEVNSTKSEHDSVLEVFFSDPDAAAKDSIAQAVNRNIINFITSVTKKGAIDFSEEKDPAAAKKKEYEFRMQKFEEFKKFYSQDPSWEKVYEYIERFADGEHFVRSLTKPTKIKDDRYVCQLPTYDQNKFELVQKPYKFTVLNFDPKRDMMPIKPDEETDTSGSPMDLPKDDKDELPF